MGSLCLLTVSGWMVCPPARNLVSPCLPLSPHMCACVDGASAFPRSCLPLSPIVSHCLPVLVSHCHPTCVLVLDGVSAFPRSCLPLSPIVSTHVCLSWMVRPPSRGLVSPCLTLSPHTGACVGWCVRLPDVLSSLDSPHVCLRWLMCPPSRGLVCPCLLVFPHVCLRWMLCPPSRGLASACLPSEGVSAFPRSCLSLSPVVSPCVCCARLPEVLSPLASACGPSSPTCVPVLDGGPSFLRSCPLICHFCPHACLCWMACLPSRGLVSPCLPLSPLITGPVLDGVSTFPRSCFLLSPIVSAHVCL